MKEIKVLDFKSSQLNPAFDSVSSIEIDDNPFDRGGFGEVYECSSIDGNNIAVKQVIKILTDDGTGSSYRGRQTIIKLQDRIIAHNADLKKNNATPVEKISALQALPQFSFKGELKGKEVLGYSANLLDHNKWTNFGNILQGVDKEKRQQAQNIFYNKTLESRLKMGYDLVVGFKHLQDMNFIYADLNPVNFFVNLDEDSLCLIDYEGGAVNENPETYGKPGEWLAAEIQEQLLNSTSGLTKVDLNTDTWAVAIAIHSMLFPFHPIFYLRVRGKVEMEEYSSQHKWPEVDRLDANFRKELESTYNFYLQELNSTIPKELIRGFSETFNQGFKNPNRRLSYKQWIQIISSLMHPPSILSFSVDNPFIIDGTPVRLEWKIDKSSHTVHIDNGVGDVTHLNSVTVAPFKQTSYTLKAIGCFGEDERTVVVKVFPTPIVESIFVPAPLVREATSFQLNYPKFPAVDISVREVTNRVALNDSIINMRQPEFNMYSIPQVELPQAKTISLWKDVLLPFMFSYARKKKRRSKHKRR